MIEGVSPAEDLQAICSIQKPVGIRATEKLVQHGVNWHTKHVDVLAGSRKVHKGTDHGSKISGIQCQRRSRYWWYCGNSGRTRHSGNLGCTRPTNLCNDRRVVAKNPEYRIPISPVGGIRMRSE